MRAALSRKYVFGLIAAVSCGLAASPAYALKTTCSQLKCPPGGPTFASFHNSRVQHPEIVLIFWQDAGLNQWTSGSNAPTMTQFIGTALSLVNLPWSAGLGQYGTLQGSTGSIDRLRLAPMTPVFTGPAPGSGATTSSFQRADLDAIIQNLVAAGRAPPPQANDDVIYVVLLPGGAAPADCDANGCNDYVPANPPYERVSVNSNAPGQTLSHEIAEAITAGWQGAQICAGSVTNGCTLANACTYDGKYAFGNYGIADICECATEAQNNTSDNAFQIEGYWSAQDGACVIPESWGPLYVNANDGTGWQAPLGAFNVRQIYGGAGGVIATDTSDDLYLYDGTEWVGSEVLQKGTPPRFRHVDTEIGRQGAEFAAGGLVIAGIPLDTKYGVNYYDLTTSTWVAIGAPPAAIPAVTGVRVTSGGWIVVTDTTGSPWYWDWSVSPRRWVNFGGPGDQFIAAGADILGLNPARTGAYGWAGAGFGATGTWTQRESFGSFGSAGIVASPDAPSAFGDLGEGNQWLWQSGTGSFANGFVGYAASNAAKAGFLGLTTAGNVYACAGSQCLNTGGVAGRLISGDKMFVTGCGAAGCVNY